MSNFYLQFSQAAFVVEDGLQYSFDLFLINFICRNIKWKLTRCNRKVSKVCGFSFAPLEFFPFGATPVYCALMFINL